MTQHVRRIALVAFVAATLIPLEAATVSRQHAETFARKLALIRQHAENPEPGARRTPLTEDELNSWMAFHAAPVLPNVVVDPQVSILGQGKVSGRAIVDFDEVARQRGSGSTLDPWTFVGGKLPVTVTGTLRTADGMGRFELETAEVSGVPVPATLLQEFVSYYSRTPDRPDGLRLGEPFPLPSNIQRIEMGQGQAVVVQ